MQDNSTILSAHPTTISSMAHRYTISNWPTTIILIITQQFDNRFQISALSTHDTPKRRHVAREQTRDAISLSYSVIIQSLLPSLMESCSFPLLQTGVVSVIPYTMAIHYNTGHSDRYIDTFNMHFGVFRCLIDITRVFFAAALNCLVDHPLLPIIKCKLYSTVQVSPM